MRKSSAFPTAFFIRCGYAADCGAAAQPRCHYGGAGEAELRRTSSGTAAIAICVAPGWNWVADDWNTVADDRNTVADDRNTVADDWNTVADDRNMVAAGWNTVAGELGAWCVILQEMNSHSPDIPPSKLVSALRGFNLLPAIVFLPTRRKCDEAASEVALDKSQRAEPERQTKRQEIFDAFAAEFPEVAGHKHSKVIVRAGVAAHHAGHIPSWKLLIERMMSAGLLNALFATSTVAAGVDFPARSVVISNADTRGNDGWRALTASELQQMTGRAGRRGRDNVGFVVLAPGQFQNPKKIAELLSSKPDPLESRFRATYTSLLNLLDAFGNFAQVREIAERSFAFRESRRMSADSRGVDGAEMLSDQIWEPFERRAKVLDHFGYLDFDGEKVTETGKWLADLRIDRPLLVGEGLSQGVFDDLKISEAAGLMASVASDADRSYGEMRASRRMTDILANFEDLVVAVSNIEYKNRVEPAEEINYSAAAAAERWTAGMDWDELVMRTRAEEGDLVRLLSRTGEALRQLANLRNSNPTAAAIAQAASEAILREPVR